MGDVPDDPIVASIEGGRDVPPPEPREPEAPEPAPRRTGDVKFSPEVQRLLDVAEGISKPTPEIAARIRQCAKFGLTDVGNARRMHAYFGEDFCVRREDEMASGTVLVWQSTHWAARLGAAALFMCSQSLGALIRHEAATIKGTPRERAEIVAGEAAVAELATLSDDDQSAATRLQRSRLKAIAKQGMQFAARVNNRIDEHRAWADTSESKMHVEAMGEMPMPFWRQAPSEFNHDTLRLATLTHTLTFTRILDEECPDPGLARIADVAVQAIPGHRREDYITAVIPVACNPAARRPLFDAFINKYQPDPETRRCVQQYCGVCLTAILVQRFMLHWGRGANGKSVFLEAFARIMGDFAVTLPNETVSGGPRNAGQATPDLMALFGRRMARVIELEADQPLNVSMIKRLTGGESVTGRPLFGGFVNFSPMTKLQLTTNGEPDIEDSSNAIWRRMLLVEWPIHIPEAEQREFEEVVGKLWAEAEGILLWAMDGLKDYLINGFTLSEEMRAQLANYRGDMDWTENFIPDCLEIDPTGSQDWMVSADDLYAVYVEWAYNLGNTPGTQTTFGTKMGKKVKRQKLIGTRYYMNIRTLPDAQMADTMRVNEYRRRKR
jgi:putative DNA primase/helicase